MPSVKNGYVCFYPELPRRTGYTRLSKNEIEGRDTLNRHIEQLRKSGATEVYWDIISRSSKKRPGLSQVMDLAKNQLTTEIILIRLDRLTDSHALMEDFIELIIKTNIPCRGLHDSIDLTTVGGRTHARLLVTLSRNEIERTSERFKDGWEGVRRRRKAVNPPFGYVVVDNKHALDNQEFLCLIDTQEARSKGAIAREIVEIFLAKKSLRSCVKYLNEKYGLWHSNHGGGKSGFSTSGLFQFSPAGLSYWITSPVLRGHLIYFRGQENEETIFNTHPDARIISEAEFIEIESILKRNSQIRGFGTRLAHYPLSGLIYCAECGGSCYSLKAGQRNGKERDYYYYKCKNASQGSCSSKGSIRMDVAEDAVIKKLTAAASELTQFIKPELLPPPTKLLSLKEELKKTESWGDYPEIQSLRNRLKIEIANLEQRADQSDFRLDFFKKIVVEAFSDPDFFPTQTEEYRRQVYFQLVEKIIVGQSTKTVNYKNGQSKERVIAIVKKVILKF
ncbi:recombinase family protein [Anabaena minutissima FACHB-250]|nr:recombinase family protein [Anabaena minutissima FACHB-250]